MYELESNNTVSTVTGGKFRIAEGKGHDLSAEVVKRVLDFFLT